MLQFWVPFKAPTKGAIHSESDHIRALLRIFIYLPSGKPQYMIAVCLTVTIPAAIMHHLLVSRDMPMTVRLYNAFPIAIIVLYQKIDTEWAKRFLTIYCKAIGQSDVQRGSKNLLNWRHLLRTIVPLSWRYNPFTSRLKCGTASTDIGF